LLECTNIGGTGRILAWASRLPELRTFAYVGTASIAGAGEDVAHRVIYEDESPNGCARHMVGYTRSKMLAEIAVRNEMPPEKVLVIRPSILLGDSRSLTPRSFDIAWIIVALKHLRMFFGNPDSPCDIIPVDYAANAIVKLVTGAARNTTYHVSAGPSATTCRQIIEAVNYDDPGKPPLIYGSERDLELVKAWLRNGDKPHPELGRCAAQLEYIRTGIGTKRARLLLFGLEPYWDFINLGQRFDNSRLMSDTDMGLPEPAHEYLKRTASYLDEVDPFCAATNP
jgi:nucleoside-diphosphate-sugar epimerase